MPNWTRCVEQGHRESVPISCLEPEALPSSRVHSEESICAGLPRLRLLDSNAGIKGPLRDCLGSACRSEGFAQEVGDFSDLVVRKLALDLSLKLGQGRFKHFLGHSLLLGSSNVHRDVSRRFAELEASLCLRGS